MFKISNNKKSHINKKQISYYYERRLIVMKKEFKNVTQEHRLSQSRTPIIKNLREHVLVDDNLEQGYIRIFCSPDPIEARMVLGRRFDSKNITTAVEIFVEEKIEGINKLLFVDRIITTYGYTSFERQALNRIHEYADYYGFKEILIKEEV